MGIVSYTIQGTTGTQAGLSIVNWSGLTGGDTGQPMTYSSLADKTVQVFGTIGAAITIEGSNDPNVLLSPGSAVWATLTDNFGNPLSFTTAGLNLITEAPQFVRPKCAAGSTNATVIIVANAS
jgi:hypothetical protein